MRRSSRCARAEQPPAARPRGRRPGPRGHGGRAGGHASLQSTGRPARTGRVCRSARQLPPGGAPAPTRPHYPRRMPETPPTRFAYLGPEGTFAEAALSSAVASSEGARYPQPSVAAALAAVRSGDADAALVPMENSVEGSVPATMDGLADGDPLVIVREVFLPVTMTLVARPGVALADVRSVASHPHALAQSSRWLAANLPGRLAAAHDVDRRGGRRRRGRGVRRRRLRADRRRAVRAGDPGRGHLRPRRRGHPVRAGRPARAAARSRPATTRRRWSPVVGDRTGALLELLSEFAVRGISLTRIESRPTRQRLGVYSFSLDCEGHIADRPGGRGAGRAAPGVRRRPLPRLLRARRRPGEQAGAAERRRSRVRRGAAWLAGDPRRRLHASLCTFRGDRGRATTTSAQTAGVIVR